MHLKSGMLLIGLLVLSTASASSLWSYGSPGAWCKVSSVCCQGRLQSPIALRPYSNDAVTADLPPLQFSQGYLGTIQGDLKNDGHSLKFEPEHSSRRQDVTVEGGPLPTGAIFEFAQFHFHWGQEAGSEHIFHGKRYPAEVHLVHWNRNYDSLAEAVNHPDGIAVFGFFLEIPSSNQPDRTTALDTCDKGLEVLVDEYERNPRTRQQEISLPLQVNLSHFLSETAATGDYFTYNGSLTTPPCSESVTWLLWRQSIRISKNMHNLLSTKLLDSSGATLVNNFRLAQPLHGRKVVYNTRP